MDIFYCCSALGGYFRTLGSDVSNLPPWIPNSLRSSNNIYKFRNSRCPLDLKHIFLSWNLFSGCRTGNERKLSSSLAESGQTITSAVASFLSISFETSWKIVCAFLDCGELTFRVRSQAHGTSPVGKTTLPVLSKYSILKDSLCLFEHWALLKHAPYHFPNICICIEGSGANTYALFGFNLPHIWTKQIIKLNIKIHDKVNYHYLYN